MIALRRAIKRERENLEFESLLCELGNEIFGKKAFI